MKKYFAGAVLTIGVTIFSTSLAQAQTSYEGVITLAMITSSDNDTGLAAINMKGDKMEIDIDAGVQGQIKLFPDMKMHTMTIAMMAAKRGQKVPLQEASTTDIKIDLKPLGKKATVRGLGAEAYSMSIPEADFVLWATADLPANVRVVFDNALLHIMQEDKNIASALHQLATKNMVPVRIEIAPKGMADQNATFEYVKAETKKMDDSIFELPKGIDFSVGAPGGGEPPAGDGSAPH